MCSGQLDTAVLADRATLAAQKWRVGSCIVDVKPLQGGQSSLTFSARVENGDTSEQQLVLKVAPPGLDPVRNRDVLRQARLLRSLSRADGMKVPEVLFEGQGEPPLVPPFFAMTFVRGRTFEPHLDTEPDDTPNAAIANRAREAARLLAVLHRLDAEDLGLGSESVTSVSGEVDRWDGAFETVRDLVGTRAAQVVAMLRRSMPDDSAACILHGDFRLGNMLCDSGSVNAIIDWEIWSRGDPRLDIAWFVLCSEPHAHPIAIRAHPGMPSADVLLAEYEARGGRRFTDLGWFRSLALTKMAASTALIAKHNRRAGHEDLAERTGAAVAPMLEGALNAL
jgi:aminoglycoside phosphotransferase (APT) family kinase protein